jgi:hypothetical protein
MNSNEERESISIDLWTAVKPLIDHLQRLAPGDNELRKHLRGLGETLLALGQEPVIELPAEESVATTPASPPETGEPAKSEPVTQPYASYNRNLNGHHVGSVRETLRVLRPVPTPATWRAPTVTDADLPLIAERCRLKAEGARWSATRQRLLREGADYDAQIEPQDRDIIARAKMLPECFLWMCHRDGPSPSDLEQYEELAGSFEAAAAAALLIDQIINTQNDDHDLFAHALDLAAEAQSALRVAITEIGGNTDSDQYKLFQWLKTTGAERQILIRRYMRKDDPADPLAWQALQERVQQLGERMNSTRERTKRQRGLFSKVRYHLKLIEANRGQERIYDWQKVMEAIDELIADGLPPSNRELRDCVLPVAEELPETVEPSKAMSLVLRELEQFITARPTKAESDEVLTPIITEDVRKAADLLRGRAVVLIGGLKRPQAAEALTNALELSELIWVEGRDQTYELFEPDVARPDVDVVLLAIRWSRHGFGEVKAFCDKYDKPLVRLPGGYSPNQVAFHIMSQVAERLSNKSAALVF